MAVSGKTAAPWEVPYYLGTDKPPNMETVTKAIAERVHALMETNRGSRISVTEATRTSTSLGSFSVPVKITLPQVFKNQIIIVSLDGYVKNSKINQVGSATGGQLRFLWNGVEAKNFQGLWSLSESTNELAPETWAHIVSRKWADETQGTGGDNPIAWNRDAYGLGAEPSGALPFFWTTFPRRVPADATNYTIEMCGKSSNGTISVGNLLMNAWVVG